MKVQRILYDQCNAQYCYDDVDQYVFLLSSKPAMSPYGVLNLNPHSLQLESDISHNHIQDLIAQWNVAEWLQVNDYGSWLVEYMLKHQISTVVVMSPSEPMMLQQLHIVQSILLKHHIELSIRPNTQFMISQQEFTDQYKTPPVMEVFYRWMRKKFWLLMDGDQPLWWKRNYDSENRWFDRWFDTKPDQVRFPTTRQEALDLLQDFVDTKLDRFGELEDAMYQHNDQVHHSLLSTSINFGLLTVWEVVDAVIASECAINSKEWFIRQIVWRREYMYHWFWYYKDTIYTQNALDHTLSLPKRFWWPEDSPLKMHCVNHVLHTVKNTAYSHHITRLMIIGNFTLLMWYNPHHVNQWFWEMYADAFEWVVTPNVLGMSQLVDGGNLATKPYISSANYINKMSDYCWSCYYDPKIKTWPRACPMNYLYRNFVDTHRALFKRQPYVVSNLQKVDLQQIRLDAQQFIDSVSPPYQDEIIS